MKTKIVLFFVFVYFLTASHAIGAVSINEIMYDLDESDIDWIEIWNDGSENIDPSSLKLLISNSTSNHEISSLNGEILNAGEYGIILPKIQREAFIKKWGNEKKIFTSSFSLPNLTSGDEAIVQINTGDKSSPMSSVSYDISMGANGDGNSLQYINGSWVSSFPTPGEENVLSEKDNEDVSNENDEKVGDDNTSNSNKNGSSNNKSKNIKESEPTIKTKIINKNITFAGLPFEFKVITTENKEEIKKHGKYSWNFGDGVYLEKENKEEKLFHTYLYPGEYSLVMEYYPSILSTLPKTETKMTMKVVPVEVSISKIGNAEDPYIELENKSNYEIDISGWRLLSNDKIFTFPRLSFILPKKKITMSPKITGFNINDIKNLKIAY